MSETDWDTSAAWVKGGHSGQVFVYGQGWVDPPESPEAVEIEGLRAENERLRAGVESLAGQVRTPWIAEELRALLVDES